MLPKKLQHKINQRKDDQSLRQLGASSNRIDFSSNDYLGFSKSEIIFNQAHQYLINHNIIQNGATGSRLLSGNHSLYQTVEQQVCTFHNSEAALIFNSGYDANLGFFSCVPQRNDIILYDEFCHASIRDGITMSNAKSIKFKHNDLIHLEHHLNHYQEALKDIEIYIVTESVFSMDGDSPDLKLLSQISKAHNAKLIIDEAHAIGIFGNQGNGLISELNLESDIFARIITFGKALGCHGAAVLGSKALKTYLTNFSRPFIYTTALPPHALSTIKLAYDTLQNQDLKDRSKLQHNIVFFKSELKRLDLQHVFIDSYSAIHCCIISGNESVKQAATELQDCGFDVKPILSPTVPKGKERLRFCLHAYNTEKEISEVLFLLTTFV
ncbi:pyridoxal phosphate-dependent aminotransferase family protein [uncultured Psychroserpens sp.]|uniref:aminotransferase class I/II-fold pyridoxal phosphate-dependent enzyme n=1 Tax=uncultured Psychroserpens sp. TaxID=255436 RepID=UPI00262227AF|nr:pyridoxal phosphate-dependent aminotransferase family protein [uncultured Psychroserpens sp.]